VFTLSAAALELETSEVWANTTWEDRGWPFPSPPRTFGLGFGPSLLTEKLIDRVCDWPGAVGNGDSYIFPDGSSVRANREPFATKWPVVLERRQAMWTYRRAWAAGWPDGWRADPWRFRRWLTAGAAMVGLLVGCLVVRPWRGARGADGASGPAV
jgi:hypothetical protein